MAQTSADARKFAQTSDVELLALAECMERTVGTLHTQDSIAAAGTRRRRMSAC